MTDATTSFAGNHDFTSQFPSLLERAYRVSYRILGDRDEARDVAAESLARAYARWSRLEDDAVPWVVTVAGRASIDVLRKRASARKHLSAPVVSSADDQHARRLDLQAALLGLPKRQREVVVLRYLADRSERETASALGLSTGTVKSHAARGLAALREAMGSTEEDR